MMMMMMMMKMMMMMTKMMTDRKKQSTSTIMQETSEGLQIYSEIDEIPKIFNMTKSSISKSVRQINILQK